MRILALDIGGSAVKCALYKDKQDELESLDSFKTPSTRELFIEEVETLLNSLSEPVEGIAISCPGDVDEETGMVNGTSFVPFLHFTPILEQLEKAFKVPVSMFNDAHCAALAEMKTGVGKEASHPIFVIIGSGVGVALVKDGEVKSNFDSLEEKSEKIMVDIIRSINGISASPVQSAKIFSLKKFELPSAYEGKDVFELAKQNDSQALDQLNTMYSSIATILILLQQVVKPEFIALGGGITNHPTFLEDVKKHLDELIEDKPFMLRLLEWMDTESEPASETIDLHLCTYKNDANLLGAVYHYLDSKKSETH